MTTATPEVDAGHTKLPWSVEQPCDQSPNLWIVAKDNPGVAKIEPCDYDDGEGHRLTDEDQANAALIVRAVNCHAELAAALRNSRQFILAWQHDYADKPDNEYYRGQRKLIAVALEKTDAALTKAGAL